MRLKNILSVIINLKVFINKKMDGNNISLKVGNATVFNSSDNFDPENNIVTENDQLFQNQLPATFYTSLLMVIGTPGNILVLYVYFFKWRKSTSRMFILFLTALDFVNCITTLPVEIYIMRYSLMLDKPWLCKISRFCTYTFNSSSAAILVGIAVDRYKRICRPHGQQFTANQSKYICIGCIIVALLLTWPSFIFYGTRVIKFKSFKGKSCLLQNTFDSSALPYIYFVLMMSSTVVIFTTLSVLYYFVGLQVYKHRRQRIKRKRERCAAIYFAECCSPQNNIICLQTSEVSGQKNQNERQTDDIDNDSKHLTSNKIDVSNNYAVKEKHSKDHSNREQINPVDSLNQRVGAKNELEENRSDLSKFLGKGKRTHSNLPKKSSLKDLFPNRNNVHRIQMKLRIGRSTLMLFLITITYIISFLPFYTIAIIRQACNDFVSQLTASEKMIYHVFLRSYLLSSAINPIIYSFCNNQFRTFCFDLFRKKEERRGVI